MYNLITLRSGSGWSTGDEPHQKGAVPSKTALPSDLFQGSQGGSAEWPRGLCRRSKAPYPM